MLLDKLALPHFKNLKSIHLTAIERLYLRMRDMPAEPERKQRYMSKTQDIWKAMKEASIYLEEVIVDIVPPSFIDYLSSYTGLKKLHLLSGINFVSSDNIPSLFFAKAVETHAQCLEDLCISPELEGPWCFGQHNVGFLRQLVVLKSIELRVEPVHLSSPSDGQNVVVSSVGLPCS